MGNWLKAHRRTPALVVAVIALAVAATGVATALPGKNKVDSGDIANGAVSSKDLNKKAKARWVHVDGTDGSIYQQSGGISVDRAQAGVYHVDFGSSVRKYAIVATNTDAGGGNQDTIISAERCGNAPGDQQFCAKPINSPSFIDVHVTTAGAHVDAQFNLVMIPK